jgi:PPP family 3-phenylpropionic acid transporter
MSLATRLRAHRTRLHAAAGTSVGRLRLAYFLYYAAAGTSLPYLAVYLRGKGFTGGQIGSIQMLPSLLAPFVAMGWARVADQGGDPVRILRWITAWAACSAFFLPFAATPLLVGAVVFSQSLGDRAVVPLLDAVSLEHCRAHPGASYARIRMFGSIGFVVLAFVLGQVLTLRGDRPGDVVVPATVAGFAACYALAARRLSPAPAAHTDRPAGGELWKLLGNPRLMLLLGACAIHWCACVPYSLFLGVFVRDLGLPARVTGAGITAAVLAEIGVMMSFPALERRFSPRALLAAAFLASALRWALLARSTHPAAIIGLQALHGLTYGLFWSTLVKLVGDFVPPRVRATGLALCSAVVFGGGNAVGAKLAGLGYDHYHSAGPLFLWSAGADLALAGVVVLLLAHRAVRGTDG